MSSPAFSPLRASSTETELLPPFDTKTELSSAATK
jgi:hypothetical protein